MSGPEVIWLEPNCEHRESHGHGTGRLWCEDDVWGKCETCGEEPAKYVLEPTTKEEK